MAPRSHDSCFKNGFLNLAKRLSQTHGNILVYIVMIMVIFAALGTAMLSLFSTSISSSATANESRRAFFLAEAGLRYGLSELRKPNGFSTSNIATLNDTLYKMPPSGDFNITVFGSWFKSPSVQTVNSGVLMVELVKGKIPTGFFARLTDAVPDLYLVLGKLGPSPVEPKPTANEVAKVIGFTPGSDTSFQFTISDGLFVGTKDWICMAVQPAADRTFIPSGDSDAYLDLKQNASKIFPKTDGAFQFDNRVYFYRNAKEETGYFRLSNITPEPGGSLTNPVTVAAATDYILLAPNNFFVTSKGTSGDVDIGGDMDHAASLASRNIEDLHQWDIEKPTYGQMTHLESVAGYTGDPSQPERDYLQIGPTAGMGVMWYSQNLALGGNADFCKNTPDINSRVGCFFGSGIRAFFTLEYSGSGDGFILALINGQLNQLASAGGDYAAPELLGYAGDSRVNNSGGFLDTTGLKGLQPPKIGLEFDTKINYSSTLEESLKYCSSSTNLNVDTRNDPGSSGKDAVQYVFWGNSSLNIPCRGNDSSYDDNRHEATWAPLPPDNPNWQFNTFWSINSSPAIAADGTIFVGSNSTNFYALNPDGTLKWMLDRNGPWYSPALAPSGRIYVGSGPPENRLYAINPDNGSVIWTFATGGAVTTKPAVSSNGSAIYFGSDDGFLYAVSSNGTELWKFDTGSAVKSSPALSNSENYVYFGTGSGTFYARRASDGGFVWSNTPFPNNAFRSSPVVGPGPSNSVYVGNDNGRLYAFDGSTGTERWNAYPNAGFAIQSSPAVSTDGSVVYAGSFDKNLYAFYTSNGSEKWRFTTGDGIQSPIAVDAANDHIYFGSNDNRVYAVYFDGSEKWRFTTNGDIKVKPAVKADGSVYVGSYDFHLYAINQFANPKNFRNLRVTSSSNNKIVGINERGEVMEQLDVSLGSEEDWLKGAPGTWAIRMEITRCRSGQPCEPEDVVGDYTLKTWIRQCNQSDCAGINPVLGTFFEDTRVNYKPTQHNALLKQKIHLNPADHEDFERFLFGFTSQTASGETQSATIRKFQLSFIRSNDPTIEDDPNWP